MVGEPPDTESFWFGRFGEAMSTFLVGAAIERMFSFSESSVEFLILALLLVTRSVKTSILGWEASAAVRPAALRGIFGMNSGRPRLT